MIKTTVNEFVINELNHEDYKAHPGGRKPLPLESSWHIRDREPQPDRKTEYWFALDGTCGNTLARADDLATAYKCLVQLEKEGVKTTIRPVKVDEESLTGETEINNRRRAWNSGYGA